MLFARQQADASERATIDRVLGNRSADEAAVAAATVAVVRSGAIEATATLAEEYVKAAKTILQQTVMDATAHALLLAWVGKITHRAK